MEFIKYLSLAINVKKDNYNKINVLSEKKPQIVYYKLV